MSQELETGPYFISSVSFETGRPVIRYLGTSNDHPNTIVVLPIGSPPPIVSGDILMLLTTYWDRMVHAVEYYKAWRQHPCNLLEWKNRSSFRWLSTDACENSFFVENPPGCSQSTTPLVTTILGKYLVFLDYQIWSYDVSSKNYRPRFTTTRELVHWKYWRWPCSWSYG